MSWIQIEKDSHFSLQNIPFGIFSTKTLSPKVGTAIGEYIVDLSALFEAGLFDGIEFTTNVFKEEKLNRFMSLTPKIWKETRNRIISLLSAEPCADNRLKNDKNLRNVAIIPMFNVSMHLPVNIGDFTDFYSSREHATNMGLMFGIESGLQPNWLHIPVAHHGRSSTIVVSGTNITRPCGQVQKNKNDASEGSLFSVCERLDFELEIGIFLGNCENNKLGVPIEMCDAGNYIFGAVLLCDWTARDIGAWEYVPLGPFTAKNFCTSISPWIITMDALESFRCAPSTGSMQDNPAPLSYLQDPQYSQSVYDVNLQVSLAVPSITTETMSKTNEKNVESQTAEEEIAAAPQQLPPSYVISTSNMKNLYWNAKQQLVHHSITGCLMRTGDLLGSGAISGPTPGSLGTMIELSWRGTRNILLQNNNSNTSSCHKNNSNIDSCTRNDGGNESTTSEATAITNAVDGDDIVATRHFLEDGDTVIMTGYADYVSSDSSNSSGENKDNRYRVGFGTVTGKILPTRNIK